VTPQHACPSVALAEAELSELINQREYIRVSVKELERIAAQA